MSRARFSHGFKRFSLGWVEFGLALALAGCGTLTVTPGGDQDLPDRAVQTRCRGETCDVNASCEPVDGVRQCVCEPGFTGDGLTCDDIDECADAAITCAADATCVNSPGSFMCACNPGFSGDGFTCVDIDECADGSAGCAADATCTNLPGSFECACPDGFEGDGRSSCTDIDECAAGICDVNADCENEPGSFSCTCALGYEGDGLTCAPVFDIELFFVNTPTDAQRLAFENAEARWESLIVGDLPDFTNIRAFCGVPNGTEVIDDLMIQVELEPIDGGGGVLGSAGPRCVRDTMGGERFLPASGVMRFDTADLANLEASGRLEAVILHEMGHVLGIGSAWDTMDLLENPSCDPGCVTSEPLVDVRYTGANAVAAWQSLGGDGNIPVENRLGPGSSDAHWREASALGPELMSPSLGRTNTLSIVTLQSLADLGFPIAPDDRAEAFTLSLLAGPSEPPVVMQDDLDDGPVWAQSADGTWRRLR